MDIHNKEFKRSFRGFNESEVDDFLDQVVNDYEKLYRENKQLKEEIERNQKNISQYQQLEKNLQDTLLVAQRTAEEVMSTAKQNATDLKDSTERECSNIREQARLEAKKLKENAAVEARSIVAEYERIAREAQQFLRKLKQSLEGELKTVQDTMDTLPDPDREEKRSREAATLAEQEELLRAAQR